MNDATSFLAVTAAIFAAITVLLAWMSHLESKPGGSRRGGRFSHWRLT